MRELGEFPLIERLRKMIERPDDRLLVGIGDDAAVIDYRKPLVVSTDALVENVHFRADLIDPVSLGFKAMAASVSDVAVMGARPLHALVTLFLPGHVEVEFCEAIYKGLKEADEEFHVTVVGGDIVRSPQALAISLTVFGELAGTKPLLRGGAEPGDLIFVTGDLGGSAAYLHYKEQTSGIILAPAEEWDLAMRHRRPVPPIRAAEELAFFPDCTSTNDISDGLASELKEIASASQVRMVVEAERIPTLPALRKYARLANVDPLELALFGGEDYQIVGTVKSRRAGELLARLEAVGVRVTMIGRVEDGNPGLDLLRHGVREEIVERGYDHFAAGDLKNENV